MSASLRDTSEENPYGYIVPSQLGWCKAEPIGTKRFQSNSFRALTH